MGIERDYLMRQLMMAKYYFEVLGIICTFRVWKPQK